VLPKDKMKKLINIKQSKFSQEEKIFLGLIIIAGILLRFLSLDARAIHHDESLHAIYGFYYYQNPSHGFYKYNPMLHGPLLYHLMPWIYQLIGTGTAAIRVLPALLGTFFTLLPLIFRNQLSKASIFLATTLLAFSPLLTFYSRFLRHDPLVLFCLSMMIIGYFQKKHTKAYWILIPLALQLTIKENFFITITHLLAFMVFDWLMLKKFKAPLISLFTQTKNYIIQNKKHTAIAAGLSIFVFCYFYTGAFRYAGGILDILYRQSFSYWMNQHKIERLTGPFGFQSFVLGWYEILFFCLFDLSLLFFLIRKYKKNSLIIFIPTLSLMLISFLWGSELIKFAHGPFFKLKISTDFFLLHAYMAFGVLLPFIHHRDQNRTLSFFSLWFFASLFTYSYVGEKVPWLALYPMFSGLCYFTLLFEKKFLPLINSNKKELGFTALIIFIALFNLRTNLITNFAQAGSPKEILSQVHTTKEFHEIAMNIRREIKAPFKNVTKDIPKVLMTGDAIWPGSWYMHGLPQYHHRDQGNYSQYTYMIKNVNSSKSIPKDELEKFDHRVLQFRGWWVPDYTKLTLINFLKYALFHEPWNPIGHSYVEFYRKKN